MHIFITGYMGAGKTTVGKELSDILQLPFVDLDEYIAREVKKSISQIFAEEGEDAFRQYERQALLALCAKKERHIIALGGGTICYLNNHIAILQSGIAVYLYQPWETIATYLKELPKRPLVTQNSLAELEGIFRKREHFYEQSQLTIPINTTFEAKTLANYLKLLTNR